eukprot:6720525-Pyramimonas_sp.AAC.1
MPLTVVPVGQDNPRVGYHVDEAGQPDHHLLVDARHAVLRLHVRGDDHYVAYLRVPRRGAEALERGRLRIALSRACATPRTTSWPGSAWI